MPQIDPPVVLFAFLPPLLFDAAFRLDARELRLVLRPVLLLAVPGVLVTTLVVGGLVALALGLPLGVALLFGSLVAATDPVAVIAVLKEIALPARLLVVPEAESLVNDGMAITLYTGFGGVHASGGLDLGSLGGLFLQEVLLGLARRRSTRIRLLPPDEHGRRPPHRDDAFRRAGLRQLPGRR